MDVCGLVVIAITLPCHAPTLDAPTHHNNALVLLPHFLRQFLLQSPTARLTTAKIVPLHKGAHGLVNFATTLCNHARIMVVPILQLSVVGALATTNAVLAADVTRELVLRAQEIATAIITPIALAVSRMPTACGTPILSPTANPKSNVTSHTVVWLLALPPPHLLLLPLALKLWTNAA